MKKFCLSVLLFCLVFPLSFAQKVKLKDVKVKANYLSLPRVGFPLGTTVYHVDFTTNENSISALGETPSGLKSLIKIPSYIKVDQQIGAKIDIVLDAPGGSPLEMKSDKKKNKEGKTWTEYYYSVTFNTKADIKVSDEKGNLIKEYAMPKSLTKKSNKYRSSTELKKKFKSNDFYISGRKQLLREIMRSVQLELIYDYGLDQKSDKIEFSGIKTEKHPDFNAFKRVESSIQKAFGQMTFGSKASYMDDIKPAIDFWLEKEPTYSDSDKNQKKLKWACRYNLAKAYFWGEDFENASKYAALVENGSYKSKVGKRFGKKIKTVQEKLTNLNMPSRHMVIEMTEEDKENQAVAQKEKEEAIASGDIQAFPDFNSKMAVTNDSWIKKGTTYHSGGAVIEGYFVYDVGTDYQPDFRFPKKIKFGYLKDGKIASGTIKYAGLDSIYIDTVMYLIEDVTIGTGLTGLKIRNAIVEGLQDFNKSSLKVIHPPFKQGELKMSGVQELEPQVAIYKKSDSKYYAPTGLMGFHKAMLKIVGDCPESVAYLEKVKNDKSKQSLVKRAIGFNNVPYIIETLDIYDQCN